MTLLMSGDLHTNAVVANSKGIKVCWYQSNAIIFSNRIVVP